MASSMNQPKPESGVSSGSGFGYAWRGGKPPGPETVITNPRLTPNNGADGSSYGNELIPRLFPAGHEAENVAGILIGHFRVQRRIGVGGMGSVFLATDEILKREVALKVLSPSLSLDQISIQRFQNEAQAAARLDHDNIARVFYYGEETGLHYIAYEYVPGDNLRNVIRAKSWLDPAEAVNYAIQLTAALHHSSSAGVIHRDIKPSNVLITPYGRAKLVDLGLARKTSMETSLELTMPGTTMGTFDYISPEQARDPHSVDVRSDIYSLGCTLYHMLTGEPPYPEGTVLQKLLDHQAKEPPDPARKNRRVSPMLSHVVRKMMASQPAHRYANPADLLRDLLLVARSLGAGAVPIDGQVWLTATRFKPPFWQRHFGWVATTIALCLMVSAVQLHPGLVEWTFQPKQSTQKSSNIGSSDIHPDEDNHEPVKPIASLNQPPGAESSSRNESLNEPFTPLTTKSPVFNVPESVTPTEELISTPTRETSTKPPPASDVTSVVPESTSAIRIVDGRSYSSLEAACAEASENGITIIELRYNGLREPERPIRLTNKKIVIRGVKGFRPVIRFSTGESNSDTSTRQMITVVGGTLEMVDVGLIMSVPNRFKGDHWSMFSLERPEKLQLRRVSLTLDNPYDNAACAFEQRVTGNRSLAGMGNKNDNMPTVPPELVLTESLVRGNGDLIVMQDPVAARYEMKDVAIGLDGNMLRMKLLPESIETERQSIMLELDHVTFRFGQSLVSVEGTGESTDKLPRIFVNARNNIISCGRDQSSERDQTANKRTPMISMRGLVELSDFSKSFSWRGNLNFYDRIETFVEVSLNQPFGLRLFEYADWKSLTTEGVTSSNGAVVWKAKTLDKPFAALTKENFELSAETQPAGTGASDGSPAGITLSKFPKVWPQAD